MRGRARAATLLLGFRLSTETKQNKNKQRPTSLYHCQKERGKGTPDGRTCAACYGRGPHLESHRLCPVPSLAAHSRPQPSGPSALPGPGLCPSLSRCGHPCSRPTSPSLSVKALFFPQCPPQMPPSPQASSDPTPRPPDSPAIGLAVSCRFHVVPSKPVHRRRRAVTARMFWGGILRRVFQGRGARGLGSNPSPATHQRVARGEAG